MVFQKMSSTERGSIYRYILSQMNADAQGQPKTAANTETQQRIDTLNERYINNEIDLQELLNGLSKIVLKQRK